MMTMTDLSKWTARIGYDASAQRVDKARTFLIESGHYTETEVTYSDAERIGRMMDQLYTGGWDRFESDTITVENASEWELSW